MIYILGDIHFNASKDYFREVCEQFLLWFKNWESNNKNNSLILAGDLVQDSINGGLVIQYLERLVQYSQFKEMHVVVGNHDLKKINNIPQLAYEFYKYKENVFVYEKATEVNIEDKKVLMLPYFTGINEYGLTMSEYYSNIYKNKAFKNDYDLVVGHFCGEDNSFPGAVDCVYNLNKLSGIVCLGHIHTRYVNPNRYIGSIYAGKKNENDNTRAAWYLTENNEIKEEEFPIFNEFLTVTYPDPLPYSPAIIPIYTILNCANENIARKKYGNIFIKKVTSEKVDRGALKREDLDRKFNSIKNMNMKELFNEFLKTQELDKNTIKECRAVLDKLI